MDEPLFTTREQDGKTIVEIDPDTSYVLAVNKEDDDGEGFNSDLLIRITEPVDVYAAAGLLLPVFTTLVAQHRLSIEQLMDELMLAIRMNSGPRKFRFRDNEDEEC